MKWFTRVVGQPGQYFLWKVKLQQSIASSSDQERISASGHLFLPLMGQGRLSH